MSHSSTLLLGLALCLISAYSKKIQMSEWIVPTLNHNSTVGGRADQHHEHHHHTRRKNFDLHDDDVLKLFGDIRNIKRYDDESFDLDEQNHHYFHQPFRQIQPQDDTIYDHEVNDALLQEVWPDMALHEMDSFGGNGYFRNEDDDDDKYRIGERNIWDLKSAKLGPNRDEEKNSKRYQSLFNQNNRKLDSKESRIMAWEIPSPKKKPKSKSRPNSRFQMPSSLT